MAVPGDKFTTATITHRREISADLWAIRVETPEPFVFAAGQYATLGLQGADGGLIERAYSIVSSPRERELEFFIELVPAGELTPLLFTRQLGDSVSVRRFAKGRFLVDIPTAPVDHLFLSTVTGVAPFLSLARTLALDGAQASPRRLFLIQGASRASEFGYREELEQLASVVPGFIYVPTVSRPWDEPGWTGETGRVDDLIRKYADQWFPDPSQGMAHLCGHPAMIEHGKAILERRGWTKNHLKEESYFVLPHHHE